MKPHTARPTTTTTPRAFTGEGIDSMESCRFLARLVEGLVHTCKRLIGRDAAPRRPGACRASEQHFIGRAFCVALRRTRCGLSRRQYVLGLSQKFSQHQRAYFLCEQNCGVGFNAAPRWAKRARGVVRVRVECPTPAPPPWVARRARCARRAAAAWHSKHESD